MDPLDDGAPAGTPGPERSLDDILARISALRSETRARVAALGAEVADLRDPAVPPRPLLTRPTAPPVAPVVAPAPVLVPAAAAAAAPVAAPAAPADRPLPAPARVAAPAPASLPLPPSRPRTTRTPRPSVRDAIGRHLRTLTVRLRTLAGRSEAALGSAMRAVADATVAARRLASRMSRTAVVGVASALRTVAASITTALRATVASSSAAMRATAARLRAAGTTIRDRAATVGSAATTTLADATTTARRTTSRTARTVASTVTATLRTVSSSVTVAMRASATTLTTLTTRLRVGGTALAALPTALGRHLAPILVRAVTSLRMVRPPTRAIGAAAAVVVVAAGAVLTLGAADGTSTDAPGAAAPDVSAATTAAAAPVAPIVPPTPAPEPPAPPPAAPEPAPPARRPPVALRIPAIGVEAPTVPVGLEPDGAMEIPADVSTIGWYEPGDGVGVAPGQIGTAVLAGHVDSRTQGAGAFYYLRDLAVGDEVVVEHADGTSSTWRITEIIQYPKDELPIDEVFVWDGPPRLALITCGGAFDWTVRSYTDNLVVHAEPATATDDAPAAVRS